MSVEKNLVVAGEDLESEDEAENLDDLKKVKTPRPRIEVTDVTGQKSPDKTPIVITFGEAPESDNEEFGSTISLGSSGNSLDEPGLLKLDSEAAFVLAPILPQRRSPRLDPSTIRKHRERNRSLRINIAEKFLSPVIAQNAKKYDKLSQNLSNFQMQMQDALFQSRIATGNLLKLQKELENFLEEDYLKELKILPSDEDTEVETQHNMANIVSN